MASNTVAIVGGGVAGLSAAHELVERGFGVEVYEARPALGGKAQSQYVAVSGRGGRRDLPGERGFRFFPAFYRHVIDTMARIPDRAGSVKDNLRAAPEAGVALADGQPIARFLRRLPTTPTEVIEGFMFGFGRLGFTASDSVRFGQRILRYYTSCARRRLEQYESVSWWDFLGGDHYSPSFQRHLLAVPRTMVAMDPRRGSARTIGDVSMQLICRSRQRRRPHGSPAVRADKRDMDRPVATPPRSAGCALSPRQPGASAPRPPRSDCGCRARRWPDAAPDHYLLALPLEALRPLISEELAGLHGALGRLRRLPDARFARLMSWMNGIQFYLRRDVPIIRGHLLFPDSPWALTCVSQPQFWSDDGPLEARYGDGSVRGLISVDISVFDTRGTYVRKRGRDCSPEEIASEVWQQLCAALNSRERTLLRDEDLVGWHLDDELMPQPGGGVTSRAPLLVHPPGSWHDRPEAPTALPNLTLAADYIRTHTNIASMEGANEAARRAVNAILDHCDSPAPRCAIWPLREPAVFERAKQFDERMMSSGRGRHPLDLAAAAGSALDALPRVLDRLLAGRLAPESA